jgi:hypothetical protein
MRETHDGARDFDFLIGSWKVRNRRLRERLRGSREWEEFDAEVVARPLAGRLGNEDVYRTRADGGFTGLTFRLFDASRSRWSIHWADSRRGILDPPVVGAFEGDVGVFEGEDTCDGRTVRVRFTWTRLGPCAARWEQAFSPDGGGKWETNWVMEFARDARVAEAEPAPVPEAGIVELRRYVLVRGEKETFAHGFEEYFQKAIQQAGAFVYGQFLDRGDEERWTFLRGFTSNEARGEASTAFYDGPVWREHRAEANARLVDCDNVLLLRPLPGRGIPHPAPVDGARGEEARGILVAQLLPAAAGEAETAAWRLERELGALGDGVRPSGLLVSFEGKNTFPRHTVRTDGPWAVWLGLARDEAALADALVPALDRALASGAFGPLLRGAPERVVLDPTRRSRLRWIEAG